MMLQQLQALYRAKPFRPFTLRMADGQKLPVESPEYIAFSPSGHTIFVHLRKDVLRIVDVTQIVSAVVPSRSTRPRAHVTTRNRKG